jgi:hypothetical protein
MDKEHSEKSPSGARCFEQCQQANQGGIGSLGDSQQEGKFLPRDPHSSGATEERFFEVVMATLFKVFIDGLGHLKHVHLCRAKDRL